VIEPVFGQHQGFVTAWHRFVVVMFVEEHQVENGAAHKRPQPSSNAQRLVPNHLALEAARLVEPPAKRTVELPLGLRSLEVVAQH